MPSVLSYAEAVDFLYQLRWFGAKFGLSNTRKLAALAGNPQDRLRFIHVAGTNGKGSTCAMLESVYRAAGLKTGLFTSPHLVAFGERLQVNRRLISEAGVARLVAGLQPCLRQFPAEAHPTFFEVVTVMALQYFAEEGCDLVLWETGLGGRLDATNIVTPLASVITNIQYDHQKWLGETLASIAGEKAGIIKPGVPVLTAAEEPEALAVIREAARQQRAPLTLVEGGAPEPPPLSRIELPLPGAHQRTNAALAQAVIHALQPVLPVPAAAFEAGLRHVDWPGRLQIARLSPTRTVVLDGAHNLAGARSLAGALRQLYPDRKLALILGILQDKDWSAMCRTLAPLARKIFLTRVHSERSAESSSLAAACAEANPAAEIIESADLGAALAAARGEPLTVVAGSLYLVGEAMETLRLAVTPGNGERQLNEWSASARPG